MEEAGGEERLNRLLERHGQEVVGFLMFAKAKLSESAYKELVKAAREIVEQSSNPEGGITVQKCEEILSQVFVGQTRVLEGFRHLVEAGDPSKDDHPLRLALSFMNKVKDSSSISNEDYRHFLVTLSELMTKKITNQETYLKVKKYMRHCPELFQTFETYLPPRLSNEQPCRSPNISISKQVLCITPDENHSANHSLDGNEATGNGESLHAEENDGDKIDPLPCWSPSRENELPPKVNPDMFTRYSTSYSLLPKNCLTLKTSYHTELGQFVFNDTLVSSTSGSEDCFKFRTKNHYEENIFKCEDDMFESDMLLQRYTATADFIRNLQVDKDMKIQEHLTSLHRRCIEQLYDEHGLDMLDALSEKIDTSIALVILQSRLNQKIEDLKEAQSSFNKACSNIIANNYYRSLDHRSSSFKQLDKRRMSPKALLAEAREINMARLNNGYKHLSAYNNQSTLISENVFKDINLHIHKDIDRMVRYACKSCPSEQKLMMVWTTLVQPFVSISCQLQESNGTVAPKEACEHCGLSKTFLRSIPDSSLANNFSLSSKRGGYLLNTSNKSASILDACQTEIEDGEFIPDVGNIQFGSLLGHGNGAASCDVAAPSGAGLSSQCPGHSNCDHSNKSEVHYESREGYNIEMGSSAYSKRTAELYDVKGSVPCCSLVVLLRLHQILYERLVVAKNLSAEASKRGSHTSDLYAGFKEELFNLITGSTNSSNFEKYCLTILGPRSYVLFTLNEVIDRIIKQLCKICPVAENSILQTHEEVRGPAAGKDLSCHQNTRTSPGCPTNGSLEHDHQEEGEKGSKHSGDIVKPMQNHFQRRKKRKLEKQSS
ncbi:paired amphipathic helix protein Sin3-like 6 isoform X3 [Miscanthus floridulus]|uniref:paired amphipathic helix protein Sin3-like 6 isoform X3 n=1 Tax=Miscanthus floridulus TaxID=154761 RepID=UPI003457B437